MDEVGRLTRAAGVVGGFTLLSRVTGLLRDMTVAYLFGARGANDAFVIAFRIPNLLRRLNPEVAWTNLAAGTMLKVPAVQQPEPVEKAAFLRIRLADRTLQVFGAASNLLAHFPCSIAQRVEKRPVDRQRAQTNHYSSPAPTFIASARIVVLNRKESTVWTRTILRIRREWTDTSDV